MYRYFVVGLLCAISLAACGGTSTSSTSGAASSSTLLVGQVSPVPLISGNPQTFYVYATNTGKTTISDLIWSVTAQSFESAANYKKVSTTNDINLAMSIVDQSQCKQIAAGQSCQITLLADQPSAAFLTATNGTTSLTLGGGSGLLQANTYEAVNTGNLADTLTLSPIFPINYANGATANFFIVNASSNTVTLPSPLFSGLPANISLELGVCPNPLPAGNKCQVRLVFTNPNPSSIQSLSIPLVLSGSITNPDNATTQLPPQNGDAILTATNANSGSIQSVLGQGLIVDASSGTPTAVSGTGIITNTGNGALTINSITPLDPNLLSVSNDTCSGSTLSVNQGCGYTPNLNVANIKSNGVSLLQISYNNGSGTQTQVASITWSYIAATGLESFVVTPGFKMISNTLFNQIINQTISTQSTSFPIMVTNQTSGSLAYSESISIPYTSLLPVNDSYSTYSINTESITNTPCNLPSSGNSMVLAKGSSCIYNLSITTTSKVGNSIGEIINTLYNYYTYASAVATGSLTSNNSVSRGFTLNAQPLVAQLSISIESRSSSNEFDAVQQNTTPDPKVYLAINNIGTAAVNGSLEAFLPAGFTMDLSACNSLGAGKSCSAPITMSTVNLINPGNLSTNSLISYNDSQGVVDATLPSIIYSVVDPSTPAISMTESVSGCFSGNGVTSTCYNNPNSYGGTAANIEVALTFRNKNSVAATSLTLTSPSVFTTQGYTLSSDTCVNGVAANDSCKIVYTISSSALTSAIAPNINDNSFAYSYTYGDQGQFNVSTQGKLQVSINIVVPQLTMGSLSNIVPGNSESVTVTWSGLYQGTVPAVTLAVTESDGMTPAASGITESAITCGSIAATGVTCSSGIITESSTTPGIYLLVAHSAGGIDVQQQFSVHLYLIFVTENQFSSNLGGVSGADALCMADPQAVAAGRQFKAMLSDGENRIALPTPVDWVLQANTFYYNVAGQSIGQTNSSAVFDFPVDNPINSTYYNAVWTGLNSDWTVGNYVNGDYDTADFTCYGWTESAFSTGVYGIPDISSGELISATYYGCATGHPSALYCVQQP